jgi:hypothetical protein
MKEYYRLNTKKETKMDQTKALSNLPIEPSSSAPPPHSNISHPLLESAWNENETSCHACIDTLDEEDGISLLSLFYGEVWLQW